MNRRPGFDRDPLTTLAARRAELLAIKTRDYASAFPRQSWPAETRPIIDACTGKPTPRFSAADFNARRRAQRKPAAAALYRAERARAMRQTLGQLRMIEAAIGCTVACEAAVIEWRKQA